MFTFKVIAVIVAISIFTWGFWPDRKVATSAKLKIKAYSSRYYSWLAFAEGVHKGLI